MEVRFKWQLILPYFHKKGWWILKKSHLWMMQLTRIKVLKSRSYSHTHKRTKHETSDAMCQLQSKNLYQGLRKGLM